MLSLLLDECVPCGALFFEVLCLSALARIQTWKGSIHYVNWYISWYHFNEMLWLNPSTCILGNLHILQPGPRTEDQPQWDLINQTMGIWTTQWQSPPFWISKIRLKMVEDGWRWLNHHEIHTIPPVWWNWCLKKWCLSPPGPCQICWVKDVSSWERDRLPRPLGSLAIPWDPQGVRGIVSLPPLRRIINKPPPKFTINGWYKPSIFWGYWLLICPH